MNFICLYTLFQDCIKHTSYPFFFIPSVHRPDCNCFEDEHEEKEILKKKKIKSDDVKLETASYSTRLMIFAIVYVQFFSDNVKALMGLPFRVSLQQVNVVCPFLFSVAFSAC